MTKPKVFISSPYTIGDCGENVANQMKIFDILMDLGFTPYAPLLTHFQHIYRQRKYTEWLALDLEWLQVCDFVLRLPGESKGADLEVKFAKENKIPVFYDLKKLILEYDKTKKQ
jgi:hypothetical protein